MPNVKDRFTRARYYLQTEGIGSLLSRVLSFLQSYLIQNESYYLYKHTLKERPDVEFRPRIDDFTFEIISSASEADKLAAKGIDVSQISMFAERGFDKGAIAFCVFINNELAHVGWVAMTEEAKNTFDGVPYSVDFSNGEACTGGTRTIPKYRQLGLMVYGYYKRFEYLREQGCVISRAAVATDNVASQKVHTRFNPTIYAKARFLKILWWTSYRETSLEQNPVLS